MESGALLKACSNTETKGWRKGRNGVRDVVQPPTVRPSAEPRTEETVKTCAVLHPETRLKSSARADHDTSAAYMSGVLLLIAGAKPRPQ